MWYSILALAGIMMAGDVHSEENRVTVRALSKGLQLTSWQASWTVKGEILRPVFPLPTGRILAVVKAPEDGPRELVLWSKDGHELSRSALTLSGEIKEWRISGSKLLLASTTEFVEYDTGSLHPERRRAFDCPYTEYTLYRLGPSGLWVMNEKTINYFDINGNLPVVRPRPLTPVKVPPCPASGPCSEGLIPENTEAAVADSGDLLIVETFLESYPFHNESGMRDKAWPSTATVLDTKGAIIAQKARSWTATKREWFWSVRVSGNPGIFPNDWGLVRTRHETEWLPAGKLLDSRGNDFLFVSDTTDDTTETVVRRVDRRLETQWRRSLQPALADVSVELSPTWTSSLLLHDFRCARFSSISDAGRDRKEEVFLIREIAHEQERTRYKHPRFAIGQSSEGDWLLIAY
jgi:hypothetical protein